MKKNIDYIFEGESLIYNEKELNEYLEHADNLFVLGRIQYHAGEILSAITREREMPRIGFASFFPEGYPLLEEIKKKLPKWEVVEVDARNPNLGDHIYDPDAPVIFADKRFCPQEAFSKMSRVTNSWPYKRQIYSVGIDEDFTFIAKEAKENARIIIKNLRYFDAWHKDPKFSEFWDREKKNSIVVITGPSGVGKTSFAKEFCKRESNARFPIKFTSRKPRKEELDGRDYIFTSKNTLNKMAECGEAVVYESRGELFGFPVRDFSFLEEGNDLLIVSNLNGLDAIERYLVESKNKYFMCPILLIRPYTSIVNSLNHRGTPERIEGLEQEIYEAAKNIGRFIETFLFYYQIPGVNPYYNPHDKEFRTRFSERNLESEFLDP